MGRWARKHDIRPQLVVCSSAVRARETLTRMLPCLGEPEVWVEVALYAALVYFAVQFIEGNVIMPVVQKWAVHLPPVLGLLSIVAFGLVFGVMGILFAVPLTVVAVVLVKKLWIQNDQAPT